MTLDNTHSFSNLLGVFFPSEMENVSQDRVTIPVCKEGAFCERLQSETDTPAANRAFFCTTISVSAANLSCGLPRAGDLGQREAVELFPKSFRPGGELGFKLKSEDPCLCLWFGEVGEQGFGRFDPGLPSFIWAILSPPGAAGRSWATGSKKRPQGGARDQQRNRLLRTLKKTW